MAVASQAAVILEPSAAPCSAAEPDGFGGQRDASGQVVVVGWRDAGLPVTTELGDASYEAQRVKAGV